MEKKDGADMSDRVQLKRQSEIKDKPKKISRKISLIILGIVILIFAGVLFTQVGSNSVQAGNYAELDGDLKIVKSEVTADANFYPFKLGDTNMEVLALKAEDGTIRTALNTCQVCYNSGRGYYVQDSTTKELVCQNCGNRFAPDMVEVIKGGCNPIPIMKENKTDDGTNITISRNILEESKYLFTKWTKS